MSSHGNSSSLHGNTAAVDPTNHSTASPSSTLFGCARVGGGSTSRWVACAQQAVRSVWHIICAALPFPLIGDSNVLLFKRSGSSSHQPQQQQRSTPPPQRPQQVSAAAGGGTGFNANRIVTNRDFGALTRGATTLEDIIGSSFEGSALCVLIAHSELSTDSVRLIRELHDLLDHHHNTTLPLNDDDGDDNRRSVAVNIDEQRYRNAWNTLAVVAHTYVLSLFSIEGSFIPALQTCAAPAVLVYAPVDGNLTRVGVLMGPITLHDVVKMVDECQAKWAVSPHRWK